MLAFRGAGGEPINNLLLRLLAISIEVVSSSHALREDFSSRWHTPIHCQRRQKMRLESNNLFRNERLFFITSFID
jgi:hypothetical protein